jgi:hypothetical protein
LKFTIPELLVVAGWLSRAYWTIHRSHAVTTSGANFVPQVPSASFEASCSVRFLEQYHTITGGVEALQTGDFGFALSSPSKSLGSNSVHAEVPVLNLERSLSETNTLSGWRGSEADFGVALFAFSGRQDPTVSGVIAAE